MGYNTYYRTNVFFSWLQHGSSGVWWVLMNHVECLVWYEWTWMIWAPVQFNRDRNSVFVFPIVRMFTTKFFCLPGYAPVIYLGRPERVWRGLITLTYPGMQKAVERSNQQHLAGFRWLTWQKWWCLMFTKLLCKLDLGLWMFIVNRCKEIHLVGGLKHYSFFHSVGKFVIPID